MADFEFLQRINLGEYVPTGSIIHRLDPRVRILSFTALILTITLTKSAWGLVAAAALAITGMLIAKIPARYAFRSLIIPLPFLLILALLQIFLTPVPSDMVPLWEWQFLHITPDGLLAGGMLILRFIALILLLSLSSCVTSSSESLAGMSSLLTPFKKIGLPADDLVMMLQATMRFLPLLALTAERTAKAQAARGVDWTSRKGGLLKRARRIYPLLLPLFLTALQKSERMALAMDARAYGSVKARTSLYQLHFRWTDWIALLMTAGMCVLIVLL